MRLIGNVILVEEAYLTGMIPIRLHRALVMKMPRKDVKIWYTVARLRRLVSSMAHVASMHNRLRGGGGTMVEGWGSVVDDHPTFRHCSSAPSIHAAILGEPSPLIEMICPLVLNRQLTQISGDGEITSASNLPCARSAPPAQTSRWIIQRPKIWPGWFHVSIHMMDAVQRRDEHDLVGQINYNWAIHHPRFWTAERRIWKLKTWQL